MMWAKQFPEYWKPEMAFEHQPVRIVAAEVAEVVEVEKASVVAGPLVSTSLGSDGITLLLYLERVFLCLLDNLLPGDDVNVCGNLVQRRQQFVLPR